MEHAAVATFSEGSLVNDDNLPNKYHSAFTEDTCMNGDRRHRRRYTADQLFKLKTLPASNRKPDYLDEDFYDDNGLWDPHKWHSTFLGDVAPDSLENPELGAEAEIKEKPHPRNNSGSHPDLGRISRLQNEDSGIVLCPHRKSFGSGCQVKESSNFTNSDDSSRGPFSSRRSGPSGNQSSVFSSRMLPRQQNQPPRPARSCNSQSTLPADANPKKNTFSNSGGFVSRGEQYSQHGSTSHSYASGGGVYASRKFESHKAKDVRESIPAPVSNGNVYSSDRKPDFDGSAGHDLKMSPHGSDTEDDSTWLDVDHEEEFTFENNLENMKRNFNNDINQLDALQIQSDLQTDEHSKRTKVNFAPENHAVYPINTSEADFLNLEQNSYYNSDFSQLQTSPTNGSRFSMLFKSNDSEKHLEADFDRYLQRFEFDSETYDVRRYVETVPDSPDPEPYAVPQNKHTSDQQNVLRYRQYFKTGMNQNIEVNNNCTNGYGVTSSTIKEHPKVLSLAELESGLYERQNASPKFTASVASQVISASELERDFGSPRDNDLSAFHSFVNQLPKPQTQKREPKNYLRENELESARMPQVNSTVPVSSMMPQHVNTDQNTDKNCQIPTTRHTNAPVTSSDSGMNSQISMQSLSQLAPPIPPMEAKPPPLNFLSPAQLALAAASANKSYLPPNLLLFQHQLAIHQQSQQAGKIPPPMNFNPANMLSSKYPGNSHPSDLFTPTAVMRNLSLETSKAPNSVPSSSVPASSTIGRPFPNLAPSGLTNPLLLQNPAAYLNLVSNPASVKPNDNNANSQKQQPISLAQSNFNSHPGKAMGKQQHPLTNVPPILGPPIVNPFMMNPLVGARPPIVLPTPPPSGVGRNASHLHLQQLLFRQHMTNNLLLRAHLLRQANCRATTAGQSQRQSLPNNTNNNNSAIQTSALSDIPISCQFAKQLITQPEGR